ncbi:DUF7159 family protein [Mycolicibacterium monacense]|uniref:Uncharacterized protein n=1 Tax=Mycolicibacterium monacense TaxID=85693 RepID=A0AAD1IYM8_MYCMB|nr:hypothetical protein [Mycolicibacterium monacense]MDA4101768.1 hypothetical protein [Mycolicibacterium monacense DSM 44395]ORB12077.1 hypothetical protein BST34_27750 [Mycolicibacterium monacense DSM 44395]QHP84259.1 hypothetical protein EWR22_02155 [Mycolicibacterium monacense DSM 44395]BBZ62999.1 hypothetical protein MMON_43000 [Mycolicibacterium monacense]
MDLVLGVSVTSTALRFVLVEGATGDGATVDSGTLAMPVSGDSLDALVGAVSGEGPYAAAPGQRPLAVGVTWTESVTEQAAGLMTALTARGVRNVVALSPAESAAALAAGLGDLAAQTDVAVCVAEPDVALVAVVTADTVHVDQIDRAGAGALARQVRETADSTAVYPEAVYVLGSADDVDAVVAELAGLVTAPVLSAAEADLALARGAALASAQGSVGVDAPLALAQVTTDAPRSWLTWRIPALTSVLVAAVVTFVVSLSVALGLELTPQMRSDDAATRQVASASDQAKAAVDAPAPEALPKAAPKPAAPPPPPEAPPAPPPEAVTVVDIAPAAPAPAPEVAPEVAPVIEPVYAAPEVAPPPAPVYVPPAPPVYVPPAPAYVPPPAPVAPAYTPPQAGYVPPVAPQQPRLRDRIIERLPIINRFHEPQYPY